MKHHYFHQQSADDDDVALGDAKVMGYVPTTCLLGGVHVWVIIGAGEDPCGGCFGPRAKCGGRPQTNEMARDIGHIDDIVRGFAAGLNDPTER